jgi:hypothetical protein
MKLMGIVEVPGFKDQNGRRKQEATIIKEPALVTFKITNNTDFDWPQGSYIICLFPLLKHRTFHCFVPK